MARSGKSTNRNHSIKNMAIVIVLFSIFFTLTIPVPASEKKIIKLAKNHIQYGEYYHAITELMRYQFLYPDGNHIAESMLLMGKAYFRGGNYYRATKILHLCYDKYKEKPEGDEALYSLAYIRLTQGAPFFAHRTYQQYQYIYKNGKFKEDVLADKCYSLALMNELEDAKNGIIEYNSLFHDGKYSDNLKELELMINNEKQRTKKKMWVSLVGSIFIPGFGHFYTENYSAGIFSFCSNAALIYLAYDGYRDRDRFRLLFFSFLELSFYQYSIFSSIRNVHEYNSREEFYNNIKVGLRRKF